ncbi:MAG: crossover junction endodeoxyribonuclease RuvC [Bacteroidales bacterium]|jgi:crossover junction endodeoxyribonuclease RuvC|nr:crossover junction endodeoxyribonuclease RuvC [Bacteroidales bacterium]MDD4395741.1 crossover junction endodeoxyribonuclease RuvC [Bacteroidales bacterium]
MNNETEQLILGVDPGTTIMGYALLRVHLRQSEIVELNVVKMTRLQGQNAKLKKIFESTTDILTQYKPDILAIEAPFFGKNPQSMLKLGRAQGVVIAACLHAGLPVYEYSPRKIKQAITGNGSASKEQVAAMLHAMYTFNNDSNYLDATDALAVAVCHHLQNRISVCGNDNKANNWQSFLAQNQDRIIKN